MFIPKNKFEIGSRVRLTKDVEVLSGTFTKGHEFTLTFYSHRGWDMIDDEGRKLLETAMLGDFMELVQ